MTQYYPKAGRCRGCEKVSANCSSLDFAIMPVHRRDGTDVVVICTEFRQVNRADSLKEHVRLGRGS